MTSALERRVRDRLRDLDARGLRRSLRAPAGIDLSSNDYLGLASHAAVTLAMIRGVERDGCGSTGSRLLRGEREIFADVEAQFAAFKRAARSLFFSSGYLANLAVLTTFPEAGDVIYSDALNHASLIDGIRLSRARRVVFPHNDTKALAELLREDIGDGQKFVVVESLFSMDGDFAPLAEYADLCRRAGAALVVDEAHAVGVFGERGSGLIEAAGIDDAVFVSINTAGKALGVCGAFVAGPASAIELLIQRARTFVFSTAPPPSVAAALEASLTLVQHEPGRRHRLLALAALLRERLAAGGVAVPPGASQIIPIILGDNEAALAAAERLQHAGFDVRAIRPPTVPDGTARLRVAVNVRVSEAELDRFATALSAITRDFVPCAGASS